MNGRLGSLLQWHLYRVTEKLGLLGQLAIAVFALTIVAYIVFLRPINNELVAVNAVSQAPSESVVESGVTDAQRFDAFEMALPSISTRPSAIQSFMDIAISEGLQPNEVTYKTEKRSNDPFSHYHVAFSLYEPYPDIQHFLSVLLHKLNYVSLKSITYNRESVKDERVEARVQLVFHFSRRTQEARAAGGDL